MFNDLRYALRMLIKNPGFTLVAVLSLAIGIGASTAIFSLVNAIILRSLPVPNPHELRLIQWSGTDPKIDGNTGTLKRGAAKYAVGDAFSYPHYRALRDGCSELAEICAHVGLPDVTVRARREAFVAMGSMVSGNFFSVLGVQPRLGRLLAAEDERIGAAPVTVISYRNWEREFGLDPAVLGQSILLNGTGYTIIGVLPQEFSGVNPGYTAEFYAPVSAQPQLMPNWPLGSSDRLWLLLMARLKPGVADAQFRAALDVAFGQQFGQFMQQPKMLLKAGHGGTNDERDYYRQPLLLLLGVVGVVILAACANLAGLSLARAASRQHDFAVRAAIGAGRWRLARQSLAESLLLSLSGAGMGVLLAVWGTTAISRLLSGSPDGLRYDTSLNLKVLAFALGIALLTAILSGLLPALRAARADPMAGLKSRAAIGAPKLRGARTLVATQVALSVLLLTGAGLFAQSLINLVRINPGFATENLLLIQLNPGASGYARPATAAFFEKVQDSFAEIPGVSGVTLSEHQLLAGPLSSSTFTLRGRPAAERLNPYRLTVGDSFFETFRIPILLGRGFVRADRQGAPGVAVVNETFVRNHFAGENPIGQVLRRNNADWEIVGVCRDSKYNSVKVPTPPTVYFSYRQEGIATAFVAVRTSIPPTAIVEAARRAVTGIDPGVPIAEVITQQDVRDRSIRQERMFAMLCGSLAMLAVFLSCIGVYGLMAYNVARRTGEIGIRMALGAQRSQIAWPVLRSAMLTALMGILAGIAAALVLTRIMGAMLYGVAPRDPATLIGSALLLIGVATGAAWLPARRASRIDPMVALRSE